MRLPEMTNSAVARAFQRFARGAVVGLALAGLAACGGFDASMTALGGHAIGLALAGLAAYGDEGGGSSNDRPAPAPAPAPVPAPAPAPAPPEIPTTPVREWNVGPTFRDCPECPEMVVAPSGSFLMGSRSSEGGRWDDEGPRHRVTIVRPFAVGVYEVTFGEWEACMSGGGCGGYRPDDAGWGRGRRPVIHVSWEDAKAYVQWLSRETGKAYRLLSESEWEYVARAGTTGRYHFGSSLSPSQSNYRYSGNRKTVPVGRYAANGFGLHDVHGNVWEWVEDCWNGSYVGAPVDGSAWTAGDYCSRRVLRGGSWGSGPRNLRSATRNESTASNRDVDVGFRVARTHTPLNF